MEQANNNASLTAEQQATVQLVNTKITDAIYSLAKKHNIHFFECRLKLFLDKSDNTPKIDFYHQDAFEHETMPRSLGTHKMNDVLDWNMMEKAFGAPKIINEKVLSLLDKFSTNYNIQLSNTWIFIMMKSEDRSLDILLFNGDKFEPVKPISLNEFVTG